MLATLTGRTRRLMHQFGLWHQRGANQTRLPFWCTPMARRQRAIYRQVVQFTMTSFERVAALCQSIAYLEANDIAGAVVECGVWKGGSSMAAALALLEHDSTCRQIYLFDTFTGMTPPEPIDRDMNDRPAAAWLRDASSAADMVRARCGLEEVRQAMRRTYYPWEKIHFVPGPVEETLPAAAPERIALLRLDTDWYASTRHELEHLWPRLVSGGVLIVDDYGHWQGARQAVDEYFERHGIREPLHEIDYTGRLVVKA